MLPDSQAGVGGLDSDLLLSLLGANRVLKKLKTTCRLRLSGAISLKRYSAGEVHNLQRQIFSARPWKTWVGKLGGSEINYTPMFFAFGHV